MTNGTQFITDTEDSTPIHDVNEHSIVWYSCTDDHKGTLISNIANNSNHMTINTESPSKVTTHLYST